MMLVLVGLWVHGWDPSIPAKCAGCQGPSSPRQPVLGTAPGWAWGQNVGVSHAAPAGKAGVGHPGAGLGLRKLNWVPRRNLVAHHTNLIQNQQSITLYSQIK